MRELDVLVERIVRPIRAKVTRKLQMREELLAHVTSAYEQEIEQGRSHEEALARTQDRFGDAGALRQDLQASVSTFEKLGHTYLYNSETRWGFRRVGEERLHHALRVALWHCILSALYFSLVPQLARAFSGAGTLSLTTQFSGTIIFATYQATSVYVMHRYGPFLLDKLNETQSAKYQAIGFLFMTANMLILFAVVYTVLGGYFTNPIRFALTGPIVGIPGLFAPLFGYQFWPAKLDKWRHLDLD